MSPGPSFVDILGKNCVGKMSENSMEKPMSHENLAEWYANQWQNQRSNDQRRQEGFACRQDSRKLRNETGIQTKWDTYHNNARLGDRIVEVCRWRNILITCREALEKEKSLLTDVKLCLENFLEQVYSLIGLVEQCLSKRDERHAGELTLDDPELELKKELSFLEQAKCSLSQGTHKAWEKLNKLKEVIFELTTEIEEKFEALKIDENQLNLQNTSFKVEPLESSKNSISHGAWLERCQKLKQLADHELDETQKLRENLILLSQKIKNDQEAQRERVNFVLRKRIFDTQKARDNLNWQHEKITEEMKKVFDEIEPLKKQIFDSCKALKLAETRLENRTYRGLCEQVRDEPEVGLQEEVMNLRKTLQELREKLDFVKITYNLLEDRQVVIDRDLTDKNHSLMTDVRCLEMRNKMEITEKC